MKRPAIIIGLVVLIALVVGGAEAILERTLDRQLPPLLTRELGLPVTISPIRTDILTLKAHADRFQMDGLGEPALIAEKVMVSLNWSDLLRGEIRLVTGSAEDLMLKIAAWPTDGEPLPTDYHFLEQWLPRQLDLARGRYVQQDGDEWRIHSASWRRYRDGGASVAWSEDRPAGSYDADFRLDSLDDFLGLRLFRGDLTFTPDSAKLPPSELSLRIEPGADGAAWQSTTEGRLADMEVSVQASGSESWSWPDRSSTQFDALWVDRVTELVKLFVADGVEDDLEQELLSEVPPLDLPLHQGSIAVEELRLGKEMTHDNVFRFNSSGRHLAITEILMGGLYGNLDGSAVIVSTDNGWDTAAAGDLRARETDQGLLARYLESHWYLQRGKVRLKSDGTTWAELIDNMTGIFNLTGAHRGDDETPIAIRAQLDGSPQKFALEEIEVDVGESRLTGAISFAGGRERQLSLKIRGDHADLRFLFDEDTTDENAGVAMPEALALFPGIEVFWDAQVDRLTLPNFQILDAVLSIDRGASRGDVVLSGKGVAGGSLNLRLDYESQDSQSTRVLMRITLDEVDIDRLFGAADGRLQSRTSGALVFTSQGDEISEIFKAMRGDADLSLHLRNGGDWGRESRPEEVLGFKGLASLVIENERILGVSIDRLQIGSIEQDVSGTMSVAVGREFLMIAELTSDRFNLKRVLGWIPESPEAADQSDILLVLRDMGASKLGIRIGELEWLEEPLTDVAIDFVSRENRFDLQQLDFSYEDARLTSKAALTWEGSQSRLEANGAVGELLLHEVFDDEDVLQHHRLQKPLQGSFALRSEGRTMTELVAGASGSIKLKAEPPSQRAVDIDFNRIEHGVEASVNRLVLSGSDLQGKLTYRNLERPQLEVTLAGGTLDLTPWEQDYLDPPDTGNGKDKADSKGKVSRAAENTGQFALDFLSYPARAVKGGDPTPPGERVFSSDPLDLDTLRSWDMRFEGDLDRLTSVVAEAENLSLDVTIRAGVLDAGLDIASVNGGSVAGLVHFDTGTAPPTGNLELRFLDLYMDPQQSTYPRSGHIIVDSRGASEAELAANLNGMGYIEFGKGPVDYAGLRLLTADAATSMFRALIPGAADRQPTLNCGITLADFTEGKGITPYGWAARTRTANLLGAIEVDLEKEHLELRFRSRSREGVGISIGNAFSNSVNISGPLSDPGIVPNAPSLVVRGWAAFLTAGLSIIGESVFNRVLAGGNPCKDIRKEIRQDLCTSDAPLASSPIACPTESPDESSAAGTDPAAA